MNPFIFLTLIISFASLSSVQEEAALQKNCSLGDIPSCEHLTALFIKKEQWDNAIVLGEALCKKDSMKGCTFAGTSMLSKGKVKEGVSLLTKACDGFEPYACRSLSRLFGQNKDELSSYMYSKRACHYGLGESCKGLKKPKETYGPKGLEFWNGVTTDCEDSNSSLCKNRLALLQNCSKELSEKDCLLFPGDLSIYFRAKLIQEGAKINLMKLVENQNLIKSDPKVKRFSYDLRLVFKDQKKLISDTYVLGFQKACTKKFERARNAESTTLSIYKKSYSELSSRTKSNIAAFFYTGKSEDCYDPKYGLEAFALANLDPLNPARLDIWKINGDGNLIHVQDGLSLFDR